MANEIVGDYPMKSRTKKSFLNIIFLAIQEIVVFVCGLIGPRYILLAFGSTYNGVVSSITQFCTFIALLRAGVTGAARVALYKPLANNDTGKISSILMATQKFMRKVAYIFVGYILILACVYPFIVKIDASFFDVAILVVIIGMGTFAQYYFGLTFQTLLNADQSQFIYSGFQIVTTIANTAVTVALIKFGLSIQWVKFGGAIVFFISPLLLNLYVTKKYKIDKKAPPEDGALSGKKYVMTHAIANFVHENTDIILLTVLTNPESVSIYAVYYLVMNGIKKVMTTFTTGLEAAFGSLWVTDNKSRFNLCFDIFEYLTFSFVSIIFSCTAILILPFISLYTKGMPEYQYVAFAVLLCFTQGFYCIRTPYVTVVQSCGKYKETMKGALVEAIINIVVSIVLIWKMGLIGVTIGTCVANVFRTIQFSIFTYKNIVNKKFYHLIKFFIWAGANIAVSILLFRLLPITELSWLNWVVHGAIYFAIATTILLGSSLIFYRRLLFESFRFTKRIIKRK